MSSAKRTTKSSNESDVSNVNSKDDENLIQNWSLTFTEYASQNNYVKHVPIATGDQNAPLVGSRLEVRAEIPTAADGSFRLDSNSSHDQDVTDKDLFKQNNQVYDKNQFEGGHYAHRDNAGGHGASSSKGADGRYNGIIPGQAKRTTATDRYQEIDQYSLSDKYNSVTHRINGQLVTTNKDGAISNTNRNGLHESISKNSNGQAGANNNYRSSVNVGSNKSGSLVQQQGCHSKPATLPPISGPSATNESSVSLDAVRQEFSNAQSIGSGSGSKPPVNTPAVIGKVQPIYMRFPGQRTGQMVFAEMNQQSGRVRIVSRDKEKEMLARLSWLLLDAGTFALKVTFDSIHPPLSLREHLSQPHVKTVLQRLLQQGVLTDKQWKLLYPLKKRHTSSLKYDSRTLTILLETICHLCPPYPHGWMVEPLPKDGSLSADIVRLQLLFQDITRHDTIPGELYSILFVQIRDVIVRLGGPPIRLKISRIESELINLDLQEHYIKTLRETWQADIIKKLEKLHEARTKTSKTRRSYADKLGSEAGLSPEDRVTLKKTHKLMVDTIQAEDVLDRLQQSQIIKFSDRQEILALSKKSERMQVLLEKIEESKLPYALKALCDAMKFKYKKLYDRVIDVRKQTYKEGVVMTVDYTGMTQDALANNYKNQFSRVYPFPWSDSVHASIRDIYTPLDILDSDGKKLHPSDLLPPPCYSGRGQRILLEGASGSGKSFLCAWLAFMWATQRHYFKNKYQQLLYLNVNKLNGNLETAIYRQLFPDNFGVSIETFWAMMERNARDVMIVVDGFDQSKGVDLTDILSGTRLKESTVLIAVNPDYFVEGNFSPDTKWFNLGFGDSNIKRCFKTCVTLSKCDHEQFEKLYHLSGRESWELRPHLTNPMLALKAFATFNVLRKGTIMKNMKTTCDLLEKYGAAMATHYCRKQKIDIIGFEFPEEILRAIDELDKFAFKCVLTKKVQFTEAEVLEETQTPIVLKFGAFSKFTQGSNLKFACGISRDFLAARHIADMVYEEMEATVLRNKMVKFPHYKQLMSFLYGQYRDDLDTAILQTLFDQLAARNDYCVRGNYLPAPSIASPVDGEVKVKVTRGVLQDFATSLQCLSECPDRPDMVTTIAESMPQRLIVKWDGILSLKCAQGLSSVLQNINCAISEIELELHQYHHFQLPIFLQLAKSTSLCRYMTTVKITWSSLDLMSKFLAAVMEGSKTVDTVYLTEDLSRKPVKQVTAATWAALQSACRHMTSVSKLSFLNCRVTAILYHVLQHIPSTIAFVDFTGCAFNLMCAGEIASHLHGNADIQFLDLSYTKLMGTEFVAIFQGMQMCEGIKHVRIRGARLERQCVVALSEYIKLTHSLEVLDLSDCELNTDMCTRLVSSIRQNRTLVKLVFNNTKLTYEGRQVISKTKTRIQPVYVEGLVELYG